MFASSSNIRVRYAETDKMGVVYYGYYTFYYEVGRTEAMREVGIVYSELEKAGIIMPVSSLEIKYLKPAFYDEVLRIVTKIEEMPSSKMVFKYEIYNAADALINTGATTLVFINNDTKKPCSVPDAVLNKLIPYFKEN